RAAGFPAAPSGAPLSVAASSLGAPAGPLRAATGAVPALAPLPRVVRAGDVVALAWSGVPDDAREIEVLLSVDDGAHFPLRVTAELDVRGGRALWRVPNLPVESARLRLRFGTAAGEVEAAPGECFRIVADPRLPLDLDLLHEGSWWAGPRDRAPLHATLDAVPVLQPLDASTNAVEAPPRTACGTPSTFRTRLSAAIPPVSSTPRATMLARGPEVVPLRN